LPFWGKIIGCCSSPEKVKISFYTIQIFKRKFFPFWGRATIQIRKREKFPFKNLNDIEGNFILFWRRAAPENLTPKKGKISFYIIQIYRRKFFPFSEKSNIQIQKREKFPSIYLNDIEGNFYSFCI
jgi:hypothetical protein